MTWLKTDWESWVETLLVKVDWLQMQCRSSRRVLLKRNRVALLGLSFSPQGFEAIMQEEINGSSPECSSMVSYMDASTD